MSLAPTIRSSHHPFMDREILKKHCDLSDKQINQWRENWTRWESQPRSCDDLTYAQEVIEILGPGPGIAYRVYGQKLNGKFVFDGAVGKKSKAPALSRQRLRVRVPSALLEKVLGK